jgi:predicted nucleic acid-binding protein
LSAVFADTGFWIALLNPRDSLHGKARQLDAAPQFEHVVTSEMVLVEFLNDAGARGPIIREAAVRFLDQLRNDDGVTVVPQSSQQFWTAARMFADRPDKDWSLTDCASYLVMQDHGLVEALSYDRHFEQMGFRALLRD